MARHHDEPAEGEPLVGEYMKTDVITIGPDATVKELADLFHEHGISGCPVTDADGALLGIVTEGDLVAQDADLHFPRYIQFLDAQIYLQSPKKFEERLRKITGATVKDLMTTDVLTVTPQTAVREAATIMADKRINRLPVVEGEKVVGLIARHEVLRAMGL
jgi:CBS domain-containing protein